jgi:pimeloyl-ACP methyl ester carboxylesterase
MLLLPGFDGTGELFAPLVAALGSDHDPRVVRYQDEVELDDYVESVSAALPSEGASLIAESFSGPIALALMARYPSRIRCAVLCATFAISPFRTLTRLARFVPSPLFGPSPTQRTMLRIFCLDRHGDSGLLPRAVAVIRSVPCTTIKARLRILAGIDLQGLLSEIRTPVLYLKASRDRIVAPSLSQALVSGLPNVTTKEVDGPHLLLQSRPLECARLIASFIDAQR